ncbi:MAG: alpha/beta fold hydrolase [Burkholderiales bacterium]
MPKQFQSVGDITVCYELADYTEAWRTDPPETILLYSGYCRTMEFWRAWVPLLGRDYRVLRMDPRGYGDTTKPPPGAPITAAGLANDAIGLMDALGLERVHWVGESTGGTIGLQAAADHPRRIASVTLCNGFAKQGEQTAGIYALGEADQAAAIEKYGVAEWSRRTLHYRLDVKSAPPGLPEWMSREMARTPTHVAADMFRFFSRVDLTPRLREIEAPVLMIVGGLCSERLKLHLEEVRGRLRSARIVEIPGYDHGLHFLVAEKVVAEIRSYLAAPSRDA